MKPRLIMTLLVRDEEDILERNICFHLNNGVDFIVAADNGSVDRSPSILQKYANKGFLDFSTIKEHTFEQAKWVSHLAQQAVKKHGATHLFHADADEFWLPTSGNLKDSLPHDDEVFFVPVINYLPGKSGEFSFVSKQTIVRNAYPEIAKKGKTKSTGYLLHTLPHKIMTTSAFTHVTQGNHGVESSRAYVKKYVNHVFIHHFPIRSYAQFETKVKNGGTAYKHNPDKNPNKGWQWKEWYQAYEKGSLFETYQALTIPASDRADLFKKEILHNMFVPKSIIFAKERYSVMSRLR